MLDRYGIILLDKTEIIIRVYEVDQKEWRLLQYQSTQLEKSDDDNGPKTETVIEILADFLVSDNGSHVSEWRVSARGISYPSVKQISSATGMNIETISLLREQELLCKGLFTELW
jgi:hypothetical protein